MSFKNVPEFHCHQDSLDSASTIEAFARKELELDSGTITTTEHGNMSACRRIYDIAHSKEYKGKLTPILGLEGYLRDENCEILLSSGIERTVSKKYNNGEPSFGEYLKYFHFTLHYMDEAAFKVGSRILSKADARAEKHGSERKPLFSWADLEELGAQNVTLGSGCLIGGVQHHLMKYGRLDIAEKYYQKMRSIVKPGHFFVEVFPHVCDRNWDSSVTITFEDGSEEKFKTEKRLKIDKKGTGKKNKDGWWIAKELAEAWHRKPADDYGSLREVMENRKGVPVENPKKIINVQSKEGFVINDCSAWAPGGDLQYGCNKAVIALAEKYGDKIILSGDSHYTSPDEKVLQDIRLSQSGSWRFYGSYHRKSTEEYWDYFKNVLQVPQKQFEGWVDNNFEWASKFKDFKFTKVNTLPTSFYPKDTLAHTFELIRKHGRMQDTPEQWTRLKTEIDLLHKNGTIDLLPYFMVLEDAASEYERFGELCGAARGSAGGVLLAYLLGITHVNPLKYNLSLDRFLTVDRIASGKWPDIDWDIGRRDLIDDPETGWLKRRFGDCYAQISTNTKLKLRSSVKDVARWHRSVDGKPGFVPEDIEKLTKKFLEAPQGVEDLKFVFGYDSDGTWIKGSIEYDVALQEYVKAYPKEWEVVKKIIGLTRQRGKHACGFVVTDTPVSDFIPLTSVGGTLVTQYTAGSVEAAGGLKIDFLRVNSLVDVSNAIKSVQKRHGGTEIDWSSAYPIDDNPLDVVPSMILDGVQVPLLRVVPFNGKYYDIYDLPEDQDVYRDICEARTETVFQLATNAAKKWLSHFNAVKSESGGVTRRGLDSIESLAAFTALDRPGPLDAYVGEQGKQHNMLVEYARRASGKQRVGSFPILDKLFPETFGIIVYQEQVERIFKEVGKTTAIEAQNFRIHVGKKMPMEIMKDKHVFMKGAIESIGQESAEQLWQSMETFGAYAFNASHAVGYMKLSYPCAWLKHHYPLEWWTAVLKNADKKEIDEDFWPHCGHLIAVPDINLSGDGFQIEGDKIRAPLSIVQGIGPKAHEELVRGRPYKDLDAFILNSKAKKEEKTPGGKNGRSALHVGIVNKLICSGVMDSLFTPGIEMSQRLQEYEEAVARIYGKKKPKPPDIRYTSLDLLQSYQLKKGILTSFGEDLRQMFVDIDTPGVHKDNMDSYRFKSPNADPIESSLWLHDSKTVDQFLQMSVSHKATRFAVAAYVISDERITYQGNKKMAKFVLDVEGRRYEMVKWGNSKGVLPANILNTPSFAGSLVVAVISRYSESKPPVMDEIVLVKEKLEFKEPENE